MAEVKWIKITTDIFDDEKILLIESLPDAYAIIVVWFKLLCLAGKQNNSGVFMMNTKIAYTDKMLATIFRMKETTVQLALKTFEQFGMIEIIDGVITIPNWGKHQNLDQMENRKEFMRNYMKEYREKQKLLAGKPNSKPNSKPNVNKADIDKEEEGDKRKRNKNKGSDNTLDIPLELSEMWNAFVEHRKKMNKPLTAYAKEKNFNKLMDLSDGDFETANKILKQSIDNVWQGLFPLKGGERYGTNKHSGTIKKPTDFNVGETLGE